MALNLNN